MHADKVATRYLELESLLAGGFVSQLRARRAERRLARQTKGHWEASGSNYETLFNEWNELETEASFGKPFDKEALRNIQKLLDFGIPKQHIRNWVIYGHIDTSGNLLVKDSKLKTIFVRTLGWAWHALTAFTTILFLIYAWTLPGQLPNKLLATVLVLIVFGSMAILMNSGSLSALPPSRRVRSRLNEILHE